MRFDNQEELFLACAAEPILYCHTFFPRTVRQGTPEFHIDFWGKLEDDTFDFFGAEVFRGGAKTTLCRLALSRRIAYAVSRNILSVGVSEGMALLTSRWLKKQVQYNTLWAQTYRLTPGTKWTDEFFEVNHGIENCTIAVTAKGMTSGLRGLNLDDFRPDLIYCDDICNEENTATEEGRKKVRDLIFGALVPSLAPKSEAPKRKFVLTNTALTKEDPIVEAHTDPTFQTVKYPKIITREDGTQESAWPSRWTLEECLAEKAAYTAKRRLYIWLREYGCKIVGNGETAFDGNWLQQWDVLPTDIDTYIGIDPARAKGKKAHKAAMFCIGVQRSTGNTFALEYWTDKGKNPEELWTVLCAMMLHWRPKKIGVESVAYQQVLAWYFRQKMQETRIFFPVFEFEDRRSKDERISQAFSGLSSHRKLFSNAQHTEFREKFEEWTFGMDIDLLDAGAIAICLANPWMLQKGKVVDQKTGKELDMIQAEEAEIPDLEYELGAP